MDILIIAILIIAAIILFLVELFIIPGISIAGILAGICILYVNYYAFVYIGTTAGIITLITSFVTCIYSLILFMRSKTLDKVALKKSIISKVNRNAEIPIKSGDTGITITRLSLIGYAKINGETMVVKSTVGFIDEKTKIIVKRIVDNTILVEKINN